MSQKLTATDPSPTPTGGGFVRDETYQAHANRCVQCRLPVDLSPLCTVLYVLSITQKSCVEKGAVIDKMWGSLYAISQEKFLYIDTKYLGLPIIKSMVRVD